MSGVQQAVFQNQRSFGPPPGQDAFTSDGSFTWVAPAGVTNVSVVAVGGGTGSAGGLGYKNGITVVPAASYTVVVGAGIDVRAYANLDSYFVSTGTVAGFGGDASGGGSYYGDGGGNGGLGPLPSGTGTSKSGGGAGGYSGTGAAGSLTTSGNAGAGGGGGSGLANSNGGVGGGGVGILGAGANGAATSSASVGGGGGSGGGDGSGQISNLGGPGGVPGGGCGIRGGGVIAVGGAKGALRIIWPGSSRLFPSTDTGDL